MNKLMKRLLVLATKHCPKEHHDWQEILRMSEIALSSTDDSRIENNVMRHEYRKLTDKEKQQMQLLKDKGLELHNLIESIGQSRELSLAKTKTEEAIMWAVKHVTA